MARTVQLLRHDAYCPIKAKIRAVDRFDNFVMVMIIIEITLA